MVSVNLIDRSDRSVSIAGLNMKSRDQIDNIVLTLAGVNISSGSGKKLRSSGLRNSAKLLKKIFRVRIMQKKFELLKSLEREL